MSDKTNNEAFNGNVSANNRNSTDENKDFSGITANDTNSSGIVDKTEANTTDNVEIIDGIEVTDVGYEAKNKSKELKVVIMLVLAIILLILAVLAWFAFREESEADPIESKSVEQPFELRTGGKQGWFDDYLPDSYTRVAENENSLTTDGENRSIQWLVTQSNNIENYGAASPTPNPESMGIAPGASGVLTFDVMPVEREKVKIKFTLSRILYQIAFQKDDDNKIIYGDDGEPVEATPEVIDSSQEDFDKLMEYVNSHILFFRYHGNNPDDVGNNKYSKLIDNDFVEDITFQKNGDNLLPYTINIYWIWPNTLGEAVLEDDDLSGGRESICDGSSTSGNELFKKFKESPSSFLKDYTLPDGVNLTQSYIKNPENYEELSIKYNNADQEIGDKVGYLLANLNADLAE